MSIAVEAAADSEPLWDWDARQATSASAAEQLLILHSPEVSNDYASAQPARKFLRSPADSRETCSPDPSRDDELGWQRILARFNVSAAIVSCSISGPAPFHCGYLVGFDEFRGSGGAAELLLNFAEHTWASRQRSACSTIHLSDVDHVLVSKVAAKGAQTRSLQQRLSRYKHAALLHHRRGQLALSALFFLPGATNKLSSGQMDGLRDLLPLFLNTAAAQIAERRTAQHAGLLEGMLGRMAIAMFLIDSNGRPVYCNTAGREMLALKTVLSLSSDGSLMCRIAADTKALRAAVASTIASAENGAETVLRLQAADETWQLGSVLSATDIAAPHGVVGRCALLLVHPRQSDEAPCAILHALGLLRSEQRFLSCFLHSKSLSEAAGKSGLSEETARTYLKRIRAKLGVHRQMELARLVYGLTLPLRRPVEIDHAA